MEPDAPQRHPLRELRLARGWTQAQVADRLARLAWSQSPSGGDVGVNPDMVAKWERGIKRPSARYRQLLAMLYRVDVDELGVCPPASRSTRESASLVEMLDQAAELLNKLGNAGRALRPHVLATLTDDVLTRRSVLAMLDATPLPPRSTPEVSAADLETLADQCEDAEGTVPPSALLTAVAAQLRIEAGAVHSGQSTGTRQRILRARVRLAILAGRLATHEEIGNAPAARAYLAQALDDAYQLGDQTQVATVLGYTAELAMHQGRPAAAVGHLNAARALGVADRAVTSWLARLEEAACADHDRHDAA